MKAFIRIPHPNALLASLLAVILAGATLLPVSGAETKGKKSSTKSSASGSSKKKGGSSPSKSKTDKSTKSTPKKKNSATPSSKKKSSGDSSSRSAEKETPKPKPEKPATDSPKSTPSGSEKSGIPGQPAPDLPVRDPELGISVGKTPYSFRLMPGPLPMLLAVPTLEEPLNKEAGGLARKSKNPASVVSLSPEDILGFDEQPDRVKQLILAALDLTDQNLTYTFGSADPSNGGMDCSGAIHYLLTKLGYDAVPRDASGQYVWARKHGKFFAVISNKSDSFEFGDLLPGDLLFWNGTYNVDRDPPVTHTMIYLGVQRKRAQHIMWGSSDGRTYDSKPRCGVSVFDFKMPRVDKSVRGGAKADFLGYARIPGLRE